MKKVSAKNSQAGQLIFFFSLFLTIMAFMYYMPRISIPLVISYVLYLIFSPLVPRLTKLGMGKNLAVSLILLGLVLIITVPIVKISPTIKAQTESIQYYIPKVEKYLKKNYIIVRKEVKKLTGMEIGDKFINDLMVFTRDETKNVLFKVPAFITTFLEWLLLIPLYLFFFLKDMRIFKKMILRITPNSIFERFYFLSYQFNKKIGDYILAKFIEAGIVFALITTGLIVMDVRFSFLLGTFAGVTNIIPYVGPIIGLIPAVIIGLAEYGGASPTFGAMMLLYVVTNAIDIGLVFPILVSKIVDLHPVIVVISVILGSQYFGIIGMIVSIPITAALKLMLIEVYEEVYPVNR